MAYIGNAAQTAFTSFDKQTITGDGTATYTLSHSVANEQEIEVFVNNVRQEGGSGKAYTVSGNQITFSENIASTDDCYVVFQGKALQTVVPPAGSVTDSMITGLSSSKLTGALPALDGSALTGVSAGKVLQVKSTTKTDTASFTSSSTNTFVDISGMSVSITPSSASSKILVMFTANVGQSTTATIHVRLMRDSTPIYIGDVVGSNRNQQSAILRSNSSPYSVEIGNLTGTHLDEPATTSAITYKLQGTLGSSYSGTFYLNRSGGWSDSNFVGSPASSITVMEIEA